MNWKCSLAGVGSILSWSADQSSTVAGTSAAAAAEETAAVTKRASKRPLTRGPKIAPSAAGAGCGTQKTAKWRLRRLGMSFLPSRGVCIAAT